MGGEAGVALRQQGLLHLAGHPQVGLHLGVALGEDAAFGFTEAIGRLSLRIANRATRPEWKDSSFFKRFAAPAVTKTTDH